MTDPFDSRKVGLSFPKITADLVLSSHDHFDHNYLEGVSSESLAVTAPGEYDTRGVKVWGFPTFHDNQEGKERGDNTVYLFEAEGITLCHLGDLGHLLDRKTEEELGNPDLLFIPVGGVYTIGPAEAAKVSSKLAPKYIIPMHYRIEGMEETFKDLQPVSAFLEEMGVEVAEPRDTLTVSKSGLPEATEVVVLKHG